MKRPEHTDGEQDQNQGGGRGGRGGGGGFGGGGGRGGRGGGVAKAAATKTASAKTKPKCLNQKIFGRSFIWRNKISRFCHCEHSMAIA